MKKKYLVFFAFTVLIVPYNLTAQGAETFRQEGIASWYGKEFDGRPTSSGEIYDSSKLTAAHPSLPFGTMLVVTNRHNNKKVTVKVNDRGPFVAARIIDVSRAAAEQLDMIDTGTAPVIIERIDRIAAPTAAVEPVRTSIPEDKAPPVNTPAVTQDVNTVIPAPSNIPATIPAAADTYNRQPDITQISPQIKLIPEINIVQNKIYRLQVGSYKVPRNAVDAFERLKNAGLNPAYERYTDSGDGEYFRVVLAGVRGTDVQLVIEKLRVAGFREALIREEN